MLTVSSQSTVEARRLSAALRLYGQVSKRDLTATLWKKAYDIRVKLYQGFRDARWRGSRKGARASRGIAFTEARRRFKQGQGTRLRPGLIAPAAAPAVDKHGRPLSAHQRLVWAELARRQSGIGVLGVSFLLRRWNAKRTALVANSTKKDLLATVFAAERYEQRARGGTLLASVVLSSERAQISGFGPGLGRVGERRGIVARALLLASLDTETYLAKKLGDTWREVAAANGIPLTA